jgi:hypothetical protein
MAQLLGVGWLNFQPLRLGNCNFGEYKRGIIVDTQGKDAIKKVIEEIL